ncbi:hypothetical protein D3218_16110 [Aureimonas flava]|uniref:Uncharacterized protein n=1 Tax=Aureimonas flava TaxID=2320271 RepID=A0A3A1WHQ3_9HYPH|nr:hypothetical protein [Aureimonas flava]RIX98711.1 hypothetical protein D3218_16110 [Aureimonas flava]
MAIESIPLRKLLKIMFLDARAQRSSLVRDIGTDAARAAGRTGNGGDFHQPFWSDAKAHALGERDLHASVTARVASNRHYTNLYPRLRDGFLLWWNERRRWTNQPFRTGRSLSARFQVPGLDATVKIDNLLSVQDGGGVEHFVYPYFSEEPALGEHAARLGLWVLGQAFPDVPHEELRILDVIRGRTFSIDRNPLTGGEEEDFRERYVQLLTRRDELRDG